MYASDPNFSKKVSFFLSCVEKKKVELSHPFVIEVHNSPHIQDSVLTSSDSNMHTISIHILLYCCKKGHNQLQDIIHKQVDNQ